MSNSCAVVDDAEFGEFSFLIRVGMEAGTEIGIGLQNEAFITDRLTYMHPRNKR